MWYFCSHHVFTRFANQLQCSLYVLVLQDKTEAKIRKEREKLERCERRIRKLQGAGEGRKVDQYGGEGRMVEQERGRTSEKMRLSEERVRMSEDRMRESEERMRSSEERSMRSEEKLRRGERREREPSSRGEEDRLPRAYQSNKSQDSSDNEECSPSPPPFNAVTEGCETNVDPY